MRSRRGLGVLAMCGLVLGLMAISASSALAAGEEGEWMINKATPTSLKVEAAVEIEPLGELKEKHLVLLTTSGANAIEILCGEVTNVVATVTPKVITGTLNVNKCVTFVNKKREANCDPLNQPIAAGGTAIIKLHPEKSGKYALAEGKEEGGVKIFTTLKFNEELCVALSPSVKITGKLWVEDCNNEFEVEKVTHLIQEAKLPAEKLGGLFFGANKASIDGSANVKLINAHAGLTFSGLVQ
jgi:hypothetical protein